MGAAEKKSLATPDHRPVPWVVATIRPDGTSDWRTIAVQNWFEARKQGADLLRVEPSQVRIYKVLGS